MILAGLLTVPLLVAAIGFFVFKATITWKEFLLQVGISIGVVVAGYFIARWHSLDDVEHLNGRITAKPSGSQGCCHCRMVCDGYTTVCTGSGKTRSCSSQCTGYHEECDHLQDFWWAVDTTVGRITIDQCEPNPNRVPNVWIQAKIGEPATRNHSYTNYLKADPDSLIVHDEHGKYLDEIPEYPQLYDHYKVNPVLSVGVPVPAGWQEAFREINADLGTKRQVDVAILLTKIQDPVYAQAVEAKWLYGPKNSLTVVMGVSGRQVRWVRVVTLSRVESLKVHLRDRIRGKELGNGDIPAIVREGIAREFKRKPMHDFEYLASTATPPDWAIILLYGLGLLLSVGLGVLMHKKDIFGRGFR